MSGGRGEAVARAAEALVGVPFRLHGRDPARGLDCVGLVAAALDGAGVPADPPLRYGLRNREIGEPDSVARRSGLRPAHGPPVPGDVLLVRPGPAQVHLLVCARESRFVHAHASLRRVVSMPGPPDWPVLRHWRPTDKTFEED